MTRRALTLASLGLVAVVLLGHAFWHRTTRERYVTTTVVAQPIPAASTEYRTCLVRCYVTAGHHTKETAR